MVRFPRNLDVIWGMSEEISMQQSHEQTSSNSVTVKIVNGFVSKGRGGNPAGVVLDADKLTEQDMQKIAASVGLSETAFVSTSEREGFRLDFFTPNRRIAHCGHATIAAFSHMASIGRIDDGETSKETVDGPRRIILRDGAAYMEQLSPKYQVETDWAEAGVTNAAVLDSLSLTEGDLDMRCPPTLVNTGNSFMIVGVRSGQVLRALQPDFAAISDISERLDLIGYYVYTSDITTMEHAATTRMFAPRYAIEEESATGMAAGPLACLLHDRLGVSKDNMVIAQGVYMTPASPSILDARLDIADGVITGLMVGGYGKAMESRTVQF